MYKLYENGGGLIKHSFRGSEGGTSVVDNVLSMYETEVQFPPLTQSQKHPLISCLAT